MSIQDFVRKYGYLTVETVVTDCFNNPTPSNRQALTEILADLKSALISVSDTIIR